MWLGPKWSFRTSLKKLPEDDDNEKALGLAPREVLKMLFATKVLQVVLIPRSLGRQLASEPILDHVKSWTYGLGIDYCFKCSSACAGYQAGFDIHCVHKDFFVVGVAGFARQCEQQSVHKSSFPIVAGLECIFLERNQQDGRTNCSRMDDILSASRCLDIRFIDEVNPERAIRLDMGSRMRLLTCSEDHLPGLLGLQI